MSFYPMSQNLRLAKDSVYNNSLNIIEFVNQNAKDRLINELLLEAISKGQKTLILHSSTKNSQRILKKMGLSKVSQLCWIDNDQAYLTEEQAHKVKALSKPSMLEANNTAPNDYTQNFVLEEKRRIDNYKYLNTIKKGNAYTHAQTGYIPDNILLKLQSLYAQNFDVYLSADTLSEQFYKAVQTDQEVISNVQYFYNELNELIGKWELVYESLVTDHKSKVEDEYNVKALKVLAIKTALQNYNDQSETLSKKSIFKKAEDPFNSFINGQFDNLLAFTELSEQEIKRLKKEDVSSLIKKWEIEQDEYFNNKRDQAIAFINQINCRNYDHKIINGLNEEFDFIVNDINNKGFLKKQVENNAWNFNGQLVALKNIRQQFRIANRLLSNIDYIQFKILWCDLSTNQKRMLESLCQSNSVEWLDNALVLHQRSLNKQINRVRLPGKEHDLNTLRKIKVENNLDTIHLAKKQWEAKRLSSVEQLKQSDKELYTQLFQKKYQADAIKIESLASQAKLFTSFFPVCIINSNEQNWINSDEFDQIIIFGDLEQNLTALRQTKARLVCFKSVQEKNDHIDLDWQHVLLHEQISSGLVEAPSASNRLESCKIIAAQIRALTKNAEVYQMRDTMIISFLDEQKNRLLQQQLSAFNLKKTTQLKAEEDLLDEALIFDSPRRFFLIENDLLDSLSMNEWDWQLEIIKGLEKLGFTKVNIWEKDLMMNANQVLEKLKHQLSPVKASLQKTIAE